MTILGCGTMGTAILSGILASLVQSAEAMDNDKSLPAERIPSRLPSRFYACVRSARGAKRVHDELDKYNANLHVFENDNVSAVKDSDVVLLACEPHVVDDVLGVAATGMQEALKGKLLISVLGGVSEHRLHQIIQGDSSNSSSTSKDSKGTSSSSSSSSSCTIVRAMPNTAAAIRESMTVIVTSNPPVPEETTDLVSWIFTRIGQIIYLPESHIDASTALCGSGPAFCALVAESMAAGAIRMGIPRLEAYTMVAQVMRGTTGLLQHGEHPALLRDKVCTPGGGTVAGLQVLEEGAVRGTISRAVEESAKVVGRGGRKE